MLGQTQNSKLLQPIDRVALGLMLVLSLLIGLLVWSGDRAVPYVRNFSWQEKLVGAEDNSFILTFSRPMNRASVEANLRIQPPLPGKTAWAGRRLVYTLTAPAPYDTNYKVELQKAGQSVGTQTGKLMQPFAGHFRTRDRAFVYLGLEGEEKGRLILYNLTHKQKILLTPKDQIVTDFRPYPTGDRILFAATDWSNYGPGLFEQQLYTVTTGMPLQATSQPNQTPPIGIDKILDNSDYQNLKFDLSPNGQVIVVQRVNRKNINDSGLWVLRPNASWQKFLNQPGGEFLFAPDSASLAHTQGEGVSILSLTPNAQPLDFLPKFGQVLGFARDGIRAAMVKVNSDGTQSLFLVINQGLQKELLRTTGDFINCQFDPSASTLYCLMIEVPHFKDYEQLSLEAIDLKTFKVVRLLSLPNQRDVQISLSPDGLALLLDRVVTKGTLPESEDLTTDEGQAIAKSSLMLLPLINRTSESTTAQQLPQQLPLQGFHPRWLP